MKKIWIAGILATLMLMVPITSVVGANKVEDCNCKPVNDIQVVRIERLLNRLESYTKILLVLLKHNPEIAGISQEVSNHINDIKIMIGQLKRISTDSKIICNIVEMIIKIIDTIAWRVFEIAGNFYEDNKWFIFLILMGVWASSYSVALIIWNTFEDYCDWYWVP